MPFFGPLFNEIIVEKRTLPGLVRATAINASRAKRSMIPHYQSYYEERFYSLDQIIKNHKEKSTFEDFVTSTFSPSPLNNLFMTEAHSRPSSVASHSLISESASDISSEAVLRPRGKNKMQHALRHHDLFKLSSDILRLILNLFIYYP